MRPESEIISRLREGFASLEGRSAEGECPAPERLWEAVQGGLTPEETQVLVDHVTGCPECAEAWRLAREMSADPAGSTPDLTALKRESLFSSIKIPLAVAAAILLLLVTPWLLVRESPDTLRGPEPAIVSLVSEVELLPRDEVRLRWTAGPEGSVYHLTVTTEDLDLLLERGNLEDSQFLVPAANLSPLPPGARIYWRVEMTKPDGTQVESPTFVARVE